MVVPLLIGLNIFSQKIHYNIFNPFLFIILGGIFDEYYELLYTINGHLYYSIFDHKKAQMINNAIY